MIATIGTFDSGLAALIDGHPARNIIGNPSVHVADGNAAVAGVWSVFKTLLLDNVDTISVGGVVNIQVLEQVYALNLEVLAGSNEVTTRLVDGAKFDTGLGSALGADLAGRQRMLAQRLQKEALFIASGVNVASAACSPLRTEELSKVPTGSASHL